MLNHPFVGDGPYCDHRNTSSSSTAAGTLTMWRQCGYPPDCHPKPPPDTSWVRMTTISEGRPSGE